LTYLISRIIPEFRNFKINESVVENTGLFNFNLRTLFLLSLTLSLILHPIYYAKKFSLYSQKPGANDSNYGYPDLPIALEAGHDFLPRLYYSSKPSRYFHILDRKTAVRNVGSAYATGDYVHLNAISTHYPFIQSVQSNDFLEKYDRFLVLNEDDQKWFEVRIQSNPNYQIRKLGTEEGANGLLTMFLVERRKD
jgi:hypothetical protein